ncbi:MAG: hypothetical protein ACNA8L_03400 [Luteolibacter sp.]|jgi:hypothetical protein
MESQTPPQSPTPPADAGKKPMSTGAKVGMGCGVLAMVGVIVVVLLVSWCNKTVGGYMRDFADNPERATAELMINMSPELELVGSNDAEATITFRDKASGKETTMSWSDVAEGRFSISDSEGNELTFGAANMEAVPDWVPRLPDATQVASSYHSVDGGKMTGAYMATSSMQTAELEALFAEKAGELGMEVVFNTQHSDGSQEMRMIGYKQGDRGFSVTIVREGSAEANVQIMYEDATGN